MNKVLGFISAGSLYLSTVASIFGQTTPTPQNIPLEAPAGSIKDAPLANIPQFAIQLLFIIGIVVAVAFLIYGGIKWILSGGDKAKLEAARGHIVAAIVGLVIVAGAFLIISILFQILGAPNPITEAFCVPTLLNPDPVCPTLTPTPK